MGDFDGRKKTLLQLFAYISLKNWLTTEDLLYHSMLHLARFGTQGA